MSKGNPQIEEGFTKIANELFDALIKLRVTTTQMNILLFVIRETYGFNRKFKDLSATYIASGIKRDHRNTRRAIDDLIKRRIIKVYKENTASQSRQLGINKHYTEWLREGETTHTERAKMSAVKTAHAEGAKTPCSEGVGLPYIEGAGLPPKERNKENIKENIKEISPSGGSDHDEPVDMSWLDELDPEDRKYFE